MENYFYKCPICGFVHLVPAYWVSYSPEKEMQLSHINLKTGEPCTHSLILQEDAC
ncbi:MAG: hypothetical protein N2171_05680 [Clostridia bacterium]|nr:hypothetical protein [Clostridia bacterium]